MLLLLKIKTYFLSGTGGIDFSVVSDSWCVQMQRRETRLFHLHFLSLLY